MRAEAWDLATSSSCIIWASLSTHGGADLGTNKSSHGVSVPGQGATTGSHRAEAHGQVTHECQAVRMAARQNRSACWPTLCSMRARLWPDPSRVDAPAERGASPEVTSLPAGKKVHWVQFSGPGATCAGTCGRHAIYKLVAKNDKFTKKRSIDKASKNELECE